MIELEKICKVLDISPPDIIYSNDPNIFATKTTMAISDLGSNIIYMNENCSPLTKIDEIFVLAHECRHFWQFKNKKYNFAEHTQSENIELNAYNQQAEELDAHAFTCAYLMKYFNFKPTFSKLKEETRNQIYENAKKINI